MGIFLTGQWESYDRWTGRTLIRSSPCNRERERESDHPEHRVITQNTE